MVCFKYDNVFEEYQNNKISKMTVAESKIVVHTKMRHNLDKTYFVTAKVEALLVLTVEGFACRITAIYCHNDRVLIQIVYIHGHNCHAIVYMNCFIPFPK